MYPEAGGSSSFARRAFNEFWSFFAAWARDAHLHHHDRHLGVLRAALHRRRCSWPSRCATRPGDIIVGVRRDRGAGRGQRRRRQGVGRRQHPARGRRLPHPAAAGAGRRGARALARDAGRQRRPRRRADVERLHPRDPDRHARLHGHRDDLEHGRGGQGRGDDDPGGDQPRAHRRVRDLLHAAGRRAVRAAGHAAAGRRVRRRCSA